MVGFLYSSINYCFCRKKYPIPIKLIGILLYIHVPIGLASLVLSLLLWDEEVVELFCAYTDYRHAKNLMNIIT